MPANIGQMFYIGALPWHGGGTKVDAPLTMQQAMKHGGLDWEVGEAELQTDENPPSPAQMRKALVRLDRPTGDNNRVLGVVHQGYEPLQNRAGAELFDAIFGKGEAVYHTGGYLGRGERVWLMAKINKPIDVGSGDLVEPYALFTNGHGGPFPVTICLTTVRIVCQNTLNLAIRKAKTQFRRAHKGTALQHALAAELFWKSALDQCDDAQRSFRALASRRCSDAEFDALVAKLLPLPPVPREATPGSKAAERTKQRQEAVYEQRREVRRLRDEGAGTKLDSASGTLWGALNAVTEFIDHKSQAGSIGALLGSGMAFKQRAYKLVLGMYDQSA